MHLQSKEGIYPGLVWILSGLALTAYCVLGFVGTPIPGVEELVEFISTVDGWYIYLAAFVSIFVEGLYVIGSFFPGSTLVLILAILSQVGGVSVFIGTILSIFVGWCASGAINIFLAKTYHLKVVGAESRDDYAVVDRPWTTWYPAFRANYEVQQIAEGGAPLKVFLSSLRVKVWASLAAALSTLLIPLFIDIHETSNDEGFFSVAVVAVITFIVGGIKLRSYFRRTKHLKM